MFDNWRNTFMLTIPVRIILAFQSSYLHPDEHFQGFEVLTARFLGYNTNIPWEFKSVPSRSILPLLLEYPVVYLNQWLNLPPITVYYLTRLEFCLISWVVTDWCLYKIMPTKQERLKAIFFNSISYITLCYQSHTFSNSMETVLVLLCLVIFEDLRDTIEVKDRLTTGARAERVQSHVIQGVYLGILVALGVLNRATFILWLVVPSYFVFQFGFMLSYKFIVATGLSTLSSLLIGFGVDIWWFNKKLLTKLVIPNLHRFVVSKDFKFLKQAVTELYASIIASPSSLPLLNNVTYNLNPENLASHGLHERYTHILVNLPIMFGPLILLIVFPKNYTKTTPFLSFVSGVVLLSLFPHQELRFLLPALPLGCCFIDLWLWTKVEKIEEVPEGKEKSQKKSEGTEEGDETTEVAKEDPNFIRKDSKLIPVIIKAALLFNLGMCFLMGVLHQGGVIPALEFLGQRNQSTKSVSIWWRTYSPPLWILGDKSVSHFQQPDPELRLIEFLNYISDDIPQSANSVVDIAGMDPDILKFSLDGMLQNSEIPATTDVLFVAPVASFKNEFANDTRFNFTELYQYNSHLDFDHFDDFNKYGAAVFTPGLGIWKVESLTPIHEFWED